MRTKGFIGALCLNIVGVMVSGPLMAQSPSWNFPSENAPGFESVLETEMQEMPKKKPKKQVRFAEEEASTTQKPKVTKNEPMVVHEPMTREDIAIKQANIAKKNLYDLIYNLYRFTSPSAIKLEYKGQPTKKDVDGIIQAINKYLADPVLSEEDKTLVLNTIANLNIALDQDDAPAATARLNALGKLLNLGRDLLTSIKKVVTAIAQSIAAKKSKIAQSFDEEAQLEKALAVQKAENQKQQEEQEEDVRGSRRQRQRQEEAQKRMQQQLEEQRVQQERYQQSLGER